MGKHSRKNKVFHESHLRAVLAKLDECEVDGKPLPGQPVVYGPGRVRKDTVEFFTTSDGRRYAVAQDGSFRRAPEGKILPVWGGEPC